MPKKKLTLILGSGFSAPFGIPTTAQLNSSLLVDQHGPVLNADWESKISVVIRNFWQDVFGYTNGNLPTLEDHFTTLDLAANSGHNLGACYQPSKLRAIRRMSIQRIFQVLNQDITKMLALRRSLFEYWRRTYELTIVSLNWDILTENSLSNGVNYGIEILPDNGSFVSDEGIVLLKLHGSSNWIYCDSCRRIYGGKEKTALYKGVYTRYDDFGLFFASLPEDDFDEPRRSDRKCLHCGSLLGGRIATFSYRKDLSPAFLQALWDLAGKHLSESDKWLVIGYSLPEADYEFRHLLKRSQLARRRQSPLEIEVVVMKDCPALLRYEAFFGALNIKSSNSGFINWVKTNVPNTELKDVPA